MGEKEKTKIVINEDESETMEKEEYFLTCHQKQLAFGEFKFKLNLKEKKNRKMKIAFY